MKFTESVTREIKEETVVLLEEGVYFYYIEEENYSNRYYKVTVSDDEVDILKLEIEWDRYSITLLVDEYELPYILFKFLAGKGDENSKIITETEFNLVKQQILNKL